MMLTTGRDACRSPSLHPICCAVKLNCGASINDLYAPESAAQEFARSILAGKSTHPIVTTGVDAESACGIASAIIRVRIQTPRHSIRMKPMTRILSSLLALVGITGCQPSAQDDARPIKDVIEAYKDAPLGESINAVSHKLANSEIILPTEGVYENGKPLRLKVASDNQGREWVYAYTDEPEFLAAFPDGCPFVAMQFRDAFALVEHDSRFGGIFINYTDKYKYLIPREVFDEVNAAFAATRGNKSKAER